MLLLVILLAAPRLAAHCLTNAGSLALARGILLLKEDEPAALGELRQAPVRFKQALALSSDYAVARWGLARVSLVSGGIGVEGKMNYIAAAEALRPLVAESIRNPLLCRDALIALSHGGQPAEVIELHESDLPLEPAQAVSDAVALAYLGRGAPGDLTRARRLRPGDLYVNYHLWRAAQDAGDVELAAILGDTLAYFPLQAVGPADERLLDYAAEVIPAMLEEGLWDRKKTLNVVSFLVWQHNGALSVERLLEDLIERYPTDSDWPFYLAELDHRRGDLEQADVLYQQVLETEPGYAQVYLRLGMVAEARSRIPNSQSRGQLEEAVDWYHRYYELAPDDLLGLKRLVEVCTALEEVGAEDQHCRRAALQVSGFLPQVDGKPKTLKVQPKKPALAVLQEALAAYTDDQRIVAQMLDVPVEDVGLGPNWVENGGFERWVEGRPEWWAWSDMATGDTQNQGLFVGGAEMLNAYSGNAVRVSGLWLQRREDQKPGRCGYWQWDEERQAHLTIPLNVEVPYLLSFYYRTEWLPDGAARVWVSYDPRVLFDRYELPATNGEWWRFAAIGWNQIGTEAAIRPMIRSFAPGNVEFDDVRVQAVELAQGTDIGEREVYFQVIKQDIFR